MFNYIIPDDMDSIELKDVSGGNSKGLATRKYENGTFTHTVVADLPDLETGFYEGWLVRGNPGDLNYSVVSTGKMTIAKGGYLLDFKSVSDYSEHSKVVITKELVSDTTPETHILEGSF